MLAPALWVPWKATVSVPTCQKEQGLREVLQRLWWELLTASSTSWLLLKAYVGRADCCFLQNVMWAELKKPFEMSKPEPHRHEMRQLQQLYISWSPIRASCLFFHLLPCFCTYGMSVTLQGAKSDCWPTPKNPLFFVGLILYQLSFLSWFSSQRICMNAHKKKRWDCGVGGMNLWSTSVYLQRYKERLTLEDFSFPSCID